MSQGHDQDDDLGAAPVASPCIGVCRLDDTGAVCTGCGRTLGEIGGWLSYDEEERRRVAALSERRRKRFL